MPLLQVLIQKMPAFLKPFSQLRMFSGNPFMDFLPVLFNLAVFLVNRFGSSLAQIPYFNLLGLHMVLTLLVFLGISYLLFVLDNLMAGRRR